MVHVHPNPEDDGDNVQVLTPDATGRGTSPPQQPRGSFITSDRLDGKWAEALRLGSR